MKDALVTGGAGFIGSRLVEALRDSGQYRSVASLDVVDGPRTDIVADVTEPLTFQADEYDFGHCFHLAGIAKEPGFPDHEYYRVNDVGTGHMLGWCSEHGVDRFTFTSTMMVFSSGEVRHGETDAPNPDTSYGASKALAEERVKAWAFEDETRVAQIVRPGVVFGPGDVGNFGRLRRALRQRVFCYVGRRDTVKSCVHLDDLVGFLLHLSTLDSAGIFHNVFPQETTIEDVVEAIFDAFGGRYRVRTVPFTVAHLGSRPFELLAAAGIETGVHRRRIEKLHRSTNISAESMLASGYELIYPDVAAAVKAWAEAEGALD